MLPDVDRFIERLSTWAHAREDIRCALVFGSRGRRDAHPWSDIDPVIITRRADRYAHGDQWLPELGSLWTYLFEPHDSFGGLVTGGITLAVFSDGLVADFTIMPERQTRWWLRMVQIGWVRRRIGYDEAARLASHMLHGGYEVVLDRDNWVDLLKRMLRRLPELTTGPPTQAAFETAVRDFWYGPAKLVGLLQRGKWFAAREEMVERGSRLMLQMAEWHARSQDSWDSQHVLRPKHLESWADSRLVEALPIILGAYGEELWQALFALQDCYHTLADETAANLGLTLPPVPSDAIIDWTRAQFESWQAFNS